MMKKIKIMPIKWINEHHDSDLDGVSNYRDCQPFNPHKQDDDDTMLDLISKIKVKIRVGDTVSAGASGTGQVTKIRGDMIRIDMGEFQQWVPMSVVRKYEWD